jgi:thiol-disulfide isomerase/thioredoxin
MRIWIVFLIFSFYNLNAQEYKEDISIVQYSAPFTSEAEVSLKKFKSYNIYRFCITEKQKVFDKEKIKYLPTVVLYHNGKEVVRIESGISLKLPENTIELVEKEIDQILESKF